MSNQIEYKGARFYRCALQVNSATYAQQYQPGSHDLSEDAYNTKVLEFCQEENIKVVGLADHGSVDQSETLRMHLTKHGIIVFPGFEIASSEKIHMVCLYSESTEKPKLDGYLAQLMGENFKKLGSEKTCPSSRSCEEISKTLKEQLGFWYAAHMTARNGILKLTGSGDNYVHLWKKDNLVIAGQIPGPIENLNVEREELRKYREIIENKNPDYRRQKPVAIINAKDIKNPKDLTNPSATCWIKMTTPTFDAFRQAFGDHESRVRLNHNLPQQHYSVIKSIKWCGAGFFREDSLAFSRHLNAIIGGRGTGKSTLIESIRYALDLTVSQDQVNRLDRFRKHNLGNSRIILEITSKTMSGQSYTISRRYGESPTVKNARGENSHQTPRELLPDLKLLGQNEILEIESNENAKLDLIYSFLPNIENINQNIAEIKRRLTENRQNIIATQGKFHELEASIAKESAIKEQAHRFKELGIENKLKNVQLVENENSIQKKIEKQFDLIKEWFGNYSDVFDLEFLETNKMNKLPNATIILQAAVALNKLKQQLDALIINGKSHLMTTREDYEKTLSTWRSASSKIKDALNQAIAKLPEHAGKSGSQLGEEYRDIIKKLTLIEALKTVHTRQKKLLATLYADRESLLEEYRQAAFERFCTVDTTIDKLNKNLDNKLRINVGSKGNFEELKQFLLNINGVGASRIEWLKNIESPDLVQWTQWIKFKNSDAFIKEYKKFGMHNSLANILTELDVEQQLKLQEIELKDTVRIELNTSHADTYSNFVSMENLSTGQKCTAILNLLLLSRDDPLIIDQPEDHLDNAFIAERIVHDLRKSKTNRQFLFATHNANIPVFGDAELIAVLGSRSNQGFILHQGSIDKSEVCSQAAEILEGGQVAFDMRKNKYGF